MEIRPVKIPNARLAEGETYTFRLLKTISLGEGDHHYVMEDPNAYKVLVPAAFYTHYGFRDGQELLCRVDRINCNGRIFLEPLHPFYREGAVYGFDVLCRGHRKDLCGEDQWYFLVKDIHGKTWEVSTSDKALWDHPPETLRCRLKRIKKGRLYLVPDDERPRQLPFVNGESYWFRIADQKIDPRENAAYYILEDDNGNKHRLRKKYYTHYGFKTGQRIRCRVDKFSSEGFYFLEPEHPCYQLGSTYHFDVKHMEELLFSDGFRQKVLVLEDCHGEETKVHLTGEEAAHYGRMQRVKARVEGIRKSRLELRLVRHKPT